MNEIIAQIVAEETAVKRHAVTTAYLAGYITRDEMNEMIWRITFGFPV